MKIYEKDKILQYAWARGTKIRSLNWAKEEAGCKYGFTMSGETPHCNTQEEGIRLQETFQREREDPQREAENAQAGAEVQNHEECVDQLGVGAC